MRTLIALLPVALCLTGCTDLIYKASFPNGSRVCCIEVDQIHYPYKVPLEKGSSGIVGSNPKWDPTPKGLKLGVTDPTPTDPANNDVSLSAGIFSENLNFGIGSNFTLRATFQRPNGPIAVGHVWAAGSVVARTGNHEDLPDERRLNLALKINKKPDRAILAVTEPGGATASKVVPEDMFLSIFDLRYPQPYTLELIVDRKTGKGKGTLKVAGYPPLSTEEFPMNYFKATGAELIKTVGATVAIFDSPTSEVSVEVLDFEIRCELGSAGCPLEGAKLIGNPGR
jgi:hypothetical protein